MRKIAFLMFVFTLLAGTSVYAQKLKNGTYRGSARGYSGEVSVKVVVSGGKIKDITVSGQSDRESAIKQIVSEIIREQNTNIDVVSGATVTSESIVFSVNNALRKKNDIVNVWEDEFKKKRLAVEEQKRHEEAERQRLARAEEERKRLEEEEKKRLEEAERKRLEEEEKKVAEEKRKTLEEDRKKFEEEKQKRIAEALNQTPVTPDESEFKYGLADGNYGGVRITKYLGTDLAIKIPEKIEGLPVTEISDDAFNSLVKIVLTDTIREISFSGLTELREVTLGSSMTLIGDKCFAECRNLKKVIIPNSVIRIGKFAFYGCKSLTSVTLPSSLDRIDGAAFEGCNSLSEVNIPASLKKVRFDSTVTYVNHGKVGVGYGGYGVMPYYTHPYNYNDDSPSFVNQIGAFKGCSSLPLATKSKLRELGYSRDF